MRQPTFSRSRRVRQQRLLRTGLGVVILIAIIAVVVNLLGGDGTSPPPPGTPVVAFESRASGYTEAGKNEEKPVSRRLVTAESDAITEILDDLYQRSFVNPDVFSAPDDAFPTDEILARFDEQARGTLADEDNLASLTLGADRSLYNRIEPDEMAARISVYFEKAREPVLAVARVTFTATGTLASGDDRPVALEQTATFHFRKDGDAWLITYYKANQTQDTVEPEPTETAS